MQTDADQTNNSENQPHDNASSTNYFLPPSEIDNTLPSSASPILSSSPLRTEVTHPTNEQYQYKLVSLSSVEDFSLKNSLSNVLQEESESNSSEEHRVSIEADKIQVEEQSNVPTTIQEESVVLEHPLQEADHNKNSETIEIQIEGNTSTLQTAIEQKSPKPSSKLKRVKKKQPTQAVLLDEPLLQQEEEEEEYDKPVVLPEEDPEDFFSITERLAKKLRFDSRKNILFIYLTILGIASGLISFTHDIIVKYMYQRRLSFIQESVPLFLKQLAGYEADTYEQIFLLEVVGWTCFNIFFLFIAMVITHFFAPAAEGSGIPPLKALLGGADLKEPISGKTFIVKVICLPLVLGVGMPVGKLGPTVHICAVLAILLMKTRLFARIYENKTLVSQMIQTGCALGIAATHGSPIGAILFALEIIGSYFGVGTYLKCFYACIIGGMIPKVFHALIAGRVIITPQWYIPIPIISDSGYNLYELPFFVAIAFGMGILGAMFIIINEKILQLRESVGRRKLLIFKCTRFAKSKLFALIENRFVWTIIVTIAVSVITYPKTIGKFMSLPIAGTLEDLFLPTPLLPQNGAKGNWITPGDGTGVLRNLLYFSICRTVLSLFSINLPIPAGVFVPFVAIGAGIGRLIGETLAYMYPLGIAGVQQFIPATYAMVGAISCIAAVTQGASAAVIILEIVGTGAHFPALISASIAVGVSQFITLGIYDSIIKLKDWNNVVELKTSKLAKIKVQDIMQRTAKDLALKLGMTSEEIIMIVRMNPAINVFPIVDQEDMLIGQISKPVLDKMISLHNRIGTPVEISNKVDYPHGICVESCLVDDAHVMFAMLHIETLFVVRLGKFVGYLTRKELKHISRRFTKSLSSRFFSFISHLFKKKTS